ncbi:hypothetical protein F2Q70_00024211 [Brassica cretica]|uniref:dolichyl-P-Man:Man5GlcNAc2-PP-dolichol alpha-1,3-mannosyltransferase n=1 Tax=Brassica cretica TaxID=69181 RepID=A0A8S9LFJ0_BRACR|nr:hypothetical protein F2Q70_00024211 [Brassica cretica]
MEASSSSSRASRSRNVPDLFKKPKIPFALALIVADAILVALIIAYVPYTKIDWDAYMSQVSGFLGGEREYGSLKGDTGPLVYPAGFLYVYSAVQNLTGGEVYPAQILFGVLYIANLSIVLLIYLKTPDVAMNIIGVLSALACAALVQILVGLPFLLAYPVSYLANAFDLGRVFIHFWSVNFKFVPERVFVSKEFAVCLLIAHLCLLAVFANYKWCKHEGGIIGFMRSRRFFLTLPSSLSFSDLLISGSLAKEHIVTTMFVGNFIGVVCARSLHYQFYSWYFYSLPYLLWRTSFPTWLRLILFLGIELCWNVYPSTPASSALLMGLHLTVLLGLWFAPSDYPYIFKPNLRHKKHK